MKQEEFRRRLIDGTIHVIANEGLDKASTKLIGQSAEVNEAYIYRCFADKEDMFAKTFSSLDDELLSEAMQHIVVMYKPDVTFLSRCWVFFLAILRFLLDNRDKCLAFIQYYYSPYFTKYSSAEHKVRYQPLVEKLSSSFQSGANIWMILNHMLATMMEFSVKVYNGMLPDDDDTAENVFCVVYASAKQYFGDNIGD